MLKDRVTRRRYGEVPMAGDAVRRFDVRDPSERRAAVAVAAAGRACVLAHAELLPSSALREWTLDVLCEQIAGPCHVLRSASRRYTYYKDEQVEEHELAPADAAAPPPPPRVCEKAYSTMAAFVEERARRRAKRRRGPGSYLQTRLLRYDLEDGGRPASRDLWAPSISRETLGVVGFSRDSGRLQTSRDSGRLRFLERLWPGRRSRSAGGDALEAFAKGEFERPGFMQTVPGVGPKVLETFERLNGPLVEEIRAAGNFGTWIATQLFVSDLGDTTLLHYDEADNLFLQARGAKRFDLYEPSHGNAAALAPFPVHSRRDRNARPGPGAAKLEVVVRDGDVLFVPAYWWHQVETLADDTLSLNFWFHSRRARVCLSEKSPVVERPPPLAQATSTSPSRTTRRTCPCRRSSCPCSRARSRCSRRTTSARPSCPTSWSASATTSAWRTRANAAGRRRSPSTTSSAPSSSSASARTSAARSSSSRSSPRSSTRAAGRPRRRSERA